MDSILYSLSSGARVNLDQQAITTHNLANADTVGFKQDLFNAQTMYLNGGQNGGESWIVEDTNLTDTHDGTLITTGRDLDVAVLGRGWLAVQGKSGKEGYTRAGDLQIDGNGMVTNGAGFTVLGDGGPIAIPPAQRVDIGKDGTISIVPLGAAPNELVVIDRLRLVTPNPRNMIKGNDGLMYSTGGAVPVDPDIQIEVGVLESSNSKAIDQLVGLISAGRQFEMQTQAMQMMDQKGGKAAQILHESS